MRERQKDRRRVNVATGSDRRKRASDDRRACPQCGSKVRTDVSTLKDGTVTTRHCDKCGWKAVSKQVDEDRLGAMAGFEMQVLGTQKRPLLLLDPAFLRLAQAKPGDTLEVKAIYTPGAKRPFSWIMKKMD